VFQPRSNLKLLVGRPRPIFEKPPHDVAYPARYLMLQPEMFCEVLAFHDSATEYVGAGVPVPVSVRRPRLVLAFSNGLTLESVGAYPDAPEPGTRNGFGCNPAPGPKRLPALDKRASEKPQEIPKGQTRLEIREYASMEGCFQTGARGRSRYICFV
jgi:hypothetical protein